MVSSISSKKRKKTSLIVVKLNSFVRFLEETSAWKNRFDFVWPSQVVQSYSIIFIYMRTTVNLFISCRKNVFLLENFNKNSFFLHEMDKLMAVLMSIEWWNKERQPLVQDSFELSWYLVCINLAKAIQSQPRRTFKRFSKHAHLPILGAPQLS